MNAPNCLRLKKSSFTAEQLKEIVPIIKKYFKVGGIFEFNPDR